MPETETLQAEGRAAPGAPIFANILCAISGNEGSFAAVEHAAALAGPQGHLTFLMVTSFRSGGAHRGAAIGPARGAEILQRAEGIAREAGVPHASEVDPGTPPARAWSSRSGVRYPSSGAGRQSRRAPCRSRSRCSLVVGHPARPN